MNDSKEEQHHAYAEKQGFHVSSSEALALLMLTLHEFPTNTERHPDGTVVVSSSVDKSIWILDMLAARGFLIKDSNMGGNFYLWTQLMKNLDARFKS